jgi:hypothetical protein
MGVLSMNELLGWIIAGLLGLLFWIVVTVWKHKPGILFTEGYEVFVFLAMISGPFTFIWAYFACKALRVKND